MVVEQGFTFTVVESRSFRDFSGAETYDEHAAFLSARRVWLPAAPGVDWLHDGAAELAGRSGVGYAIESRRQSVADGAGGGVVEVLLLLYVGAQHTEIGRRLQGDLYEWVKRRVVERRRETNYADADPAPDFSEFDVDRLAEGMKGELADIAKVPEARLRLVSAERREVVVLYAVYRDAETGVEYAVEVGRDDAIFARR